jgi:hypothetical protein
MTPVQSTGPTVGELRHRRTLVLTPTSPFHFDGTVHKPSHFPADFVAHEPGRCWQTLRLGGEALGVRMEDAGTVDRPSVAVTLFASGPIRDDVCERATAELRWRFDFDADLGAFLEMVEDVRLALDDVRLALDDRPSAVAGVLPRPRTLLCREPLGPWSGSWAPAGVVCLGVARSPA